MGTSCFFSVRRPGSYLRARSALSGAVNSPDRRRTLRTQSWTELRSICPLQRLCYQRASFPTGIRLVGGRVCGKCSSCESLGLSNRRAVPGEREGGLDPGVSSLPPGTRDASAEPVFHLPPLAPLAPQGPSGSLTHEHCTFAPFPQTQGADEPMAVTAHSKATARGGHGRECKGAS